MSKPLRKKTFIDSKVQGALVRRLMLHWLVFFAASSAIAFCLQVLSNPFLSIGNHAQNLWWTHGPFLMVMVFLLPVFVIDTIRISHRFAGPIHRLRNTIRGIANGEPTPALKFRDFDFWQGLADDFNRMVARLSKRDEPMTSVEEVDELEPAESK